MNSLAENCTKIAGLLRPISNAATLIAQASHSQKPNVKRMQLRQAGMMRIADELESASREARILASQMLHEIQKADP